MAHHTLRKEERKWLNTKELEELELCHIASMTVKERLPTERFYFALNPTDGKAAAEVDFN